MRSNKNAFSQTGRRSAVQIGKEINMFKAKTNTNRNNIAGQKMRQLRLGKGISQRVVADGLNELGLHIDKNAVQRMEAGQRFITDIELNYIAKYFGITISELLGLD